MRNRPLIALDILRDLVSRAEELWPHEIEGTDFGVSLKRAQEWLASTASTPFDDHEAIAQELMSMGWASPCDAQWDHLHDWCIKMRDAYRAALLRRKS